VDGWEFQHLHCLHADRFHLDPSEFTPMLVTANCQRLTRAAIANVVSLCTYRP
jgi:hypothetical protein